MYRQKAPAKEVRCSKRIFNRREDQQLFSKFSKNEMTNATMWDLLLHHRVVLP